MNARTIKKLLMKKCKGTLWGDRAFLTVRFPVSLIPESTNCDVCNASLDNGYSYHYKGDKLVKALCFTCDQQETFNLYIQNKRLNTRLILDNSLKLYRLNKNYDVDDEILEKMKNGADEILSHRIDIAQATNNLKKKIKEFEMEVWFKGLQNMVLGTNKRGISAKTDSHNKFHILTYTMAGRTMITIGDNNNSVTCIADESSKESRTGFHGIDATAEDALGLVQLAINLYKNQTIVFEIDNEVSMGI